jgi:ATP-dependent exoDNAse (exonuclease V) beta subunit
MSKNPAKTPPPDQAQREKALDPRRSILVQAPAGSGKTTLLAERFLCLLAEVDEPGQIVAITFTKAAAAEMRNRILDQLRKAEPSSIARRALEHSQELGWNLLDLPKQLRISTIDSFCRDLALQQPLLSGFSGSLEISEQPKELYRRAARYTVEQIGNENAALSEAIEALLLWRDNNWQDLEAQLVAMLEKRDQWMHDFVIDRDPDWDALRMRLERPFTRAVASFRYTDQEWQIVRACFTLLRHAAAQLRVVFAEAAVVDFIEVAQLAQNVLKGEDGLPTEATLAVVDGIRHLLVDEFQDTSRRQHQLLAHLIAAWPEREGRTCFVVGDSMQSIYFFRDADAELFPRVEQIGLEIPGELPLRFEPVQLQANFRSAPQLVERINDTFAKIFAVVDGSGVEYAEALPARDGSAQTGPHLVAEQDQRMHLHCEFTPQTMRGRSRGSGAERKAEIAALREAACEEQTEEIVALIRGHMARMDQAHAAREKYRIAVLGRARKSLAPIAEALREEKIPFRAVELEKLEDRPEILDALALARALLNPQDRVAWLGVLRAPWCGLSLADLHTLAGDGEAELLARPVPELLAERAQLLSGEGRTAVERVLHAIDYAERLRIAQTTASLGTWLERVWLRLGGAHCADATAHANLELLWRCFDNLPEGEPDLLGPAIDAALEKLTALPDANAESDCGVQLMTIHKAKGLEFEVVIVPDLQAGVRGGKPELLSWLERGLPPEVEASEPYEYGAITEFLVAPFQSKGADRGKARKWVDDERREREKQEARRLLYVAATRAREELHLFARPEYKTENDGALSLAGPQESLLKTAWPALKEEVQTRFGEWVSKITKPEADSALPSIIDAIAASGEDNLLQMRPRVKATVLRRLPPDTLVVKESESVAAMESGIAGLSANRLYERHEGGMLSRALGVAVHAHLQHLAQLLATQPLEAARASLTRLTPRIAAEVRAIGVDLKQASKIAAQALEITLKAASDPVAQWILAPHAEAANEVRWTGVVDGSLRTVQMDRVFRAGVSPKAADKNAWWIIDYKTAHEDDLDAAAVLPELRRIFAPQLEAYAKVLRNLHGADARVRGGLYYPRMTILDWWEL